MEIRIHDLPGEVIPHLRDGAGSVCKQAFEDDAVRIMILTLEPGSSIGPHTHDVNFEVFYGVRGKGKILVEGGADAMFPGCVHYCPQGCEHSLVNDGDETLSVFAIVAKHID